MNIFNRIMGSIVGVDKELPANACLIDVRSPAEYASGYLEGSISIPLGDLVQGISRAVPDKSTEIIVYCQSGARSAAAKNQLHSMGYQNVSNGGGIGSLAAALQKKIC
ncbi:MAG: rhodanese-like domain-containing protein [Candidatus Aquirickettsiella gammari]